MYQHWADPRCIAQSCVLNLDLNVYCYIVEVIYYRVTLFYISFFRTKPKCQNLNPIITIAVVNPRKAVLLSRMRLYYIYSVAQPLQAKRTREKIECISMFTRC